MTSRARTEIAISSHDVELGRRYSGVAPCPCIRQRRSEHAIPTSRRLRTREVGSLERPVPGMAPAAAGMTSAEFRGVTLVHEVQVFDYRPDRDREVYGKLYEFGYGTDACRVFNYWQDDHPVRVEGADARTLALANAGAAIIVVTDYGDGGDCRVMLDLARLGLKPEASATNLETGESIGRSAPGVFTLPINETRLLRSCGYNDDEPDGLVLGCLRRLRRFCGPRRGTGDNRTIPLSSPGVCEAFRRGYLPRRF